MYKERDGYVHSNRSVFTVQCKKPHQKFLFFKASVPSLRHTRPPIQGVPGVKLMEREADRSTTSSAEVKKEWNYLYF
jgi:hypothetical protein